MSAFDLATRKPNGLFGPKDEPPRAGPTLGERPPPPVAAAGSGATGGLAAEARRLDEERRELLDNAYGIGAATREPPFSTLPDLDARRDDLASRGSAAASDARREAEELAARQRAHEALVDRFTVAEARGPEDPPNAVTREEYARVLELYSSIERGTGDLSVNTRDLEEAEAAEFRNEAMHDVGSLLQTEEGRELLGLLADNFDGAQHWKTTIGPLLAEDREGGLMERLALGVCYPPAGGDGHWQRDAPPGERARFIYDEPQTARAAYNTETEGFPYFERSDTTLFHELRHALDMTTGTANWDLVPGSSPVRPDRGRVRQIEHQAVGLGDFAGERLTENAYARARKKLGAADAPGELPGDDDMKQARAYSPLLDPRFWPRSL
jgi:hypothetical protein